MSIGRISRLRECGVFRQFEWPNSLHDFGRFNLIYGWNGSGKTTLSRLFRAIEAKKPPTDSHATFCINGLDVGCNDFAQIDLPIKVFNRDFVMESVFPFGGGDVPHIFVVGKESVEKQKEIDKLKDRRVEAQNKLNSVRSAEQHAIKTLDRYCIDRARVIKDSLRSSGSTTYNNYDKSDYQNRAEKMESNGDASTHKLTESDREKLLAQHRATPKPKLKEISFQIPALKAMADEVSDLLSTTLISSAIGSLKKDPPLSTWVRQGLSLHQERHALECLFCEQAIPKNRLAELEAHFNAEYEKFMNRLDSQINEIRTASKNTSEVVRPNRAEFYEDLADEYEIAKSTLQKNIDTTTPFLDSLVQVLIEKKGRPFEPVASSISSLEIDSDAADRLNEVIRKHNQACDDFQDRIDTARKRLEAGSVAEELEEFVRCRDAIHGSVAAVKAKVAEVDQLSGEILNMEREIEEHRQPAEELNEDLRKYLGHDELRLSVKESGYTITRHGIPAKTLSEGEMTALALLYFLKSLQDRRFDLDNGVVVLDDPVSSLDANALYLAFGFIRERTKDSAQLFILTHNFTFFRQVRNWFHHLPKQNSRDVNKRPARFYMLNCLRNGDLRCACIHPLDPLLEKYESEYHYLFAAIFRAASSGSPAELEKNYALPNMSRRLLETFLAFRLPDKSGELWHKLKAVDYDEAKKIRILRFLHTHSHSDAIGEPEHDPFLLGEADAILKDLLDFIKSQDLRHFEAMVNLINSPPE